MSYNNIWIIISDDEETILSPIQIPFVPYVNTEQMRTLHSIFSRRAILIHLSPHFLTKLIKETSTNSSELFLCGSLSCPVLSSPLLDRKRLPCSWETQPVRKLRNKTRKKRIKGEYTCSLSHHMWSNILCSVGQWELLAFVLLQFLLGPRTGSWRRTKEKTELYSLSFPLSWISRWELRWKSTFLGSFFCTAFMSVLVSTTKKNQKWNLCFVNKKRRKKDFIFTLPFTICSHTY